MDVKALGLQTLILRSVLALICAALSSLTERFMMEEVKKITLLPSKATFRRYDHAHYSYSCGCWIWQGKSRFLVLCFSHHRCQAGCLKLHWDSRSIYLSFLLFLIFKKSVFSFSRFSEQRKCPILLYSFYFSPSTFSAFSCCRKEFNIAYLISWAFWNPRVKLLFPSATASSDSKL